MPAPFIEGRCYFTPEDITRICDDWGDEVHVEVNRLHYGHLSYAWVPRYVVAALIFGEGE